MEAALPVKSHARDLTESSGHESQPGSGTGSTPGRPSPYRMAWPGHTERLARLARLAAMAAGQAGQAGRTSDLGPRTSDLGPRTSDPLAPGPK
jgi:hypothetical protein